MINRHFTLRLNPMYRSKIKYMATQNGRSQNKEIETAVKRYIADFERLHGEIKIEN